MGVPINCVSDPVLLSADIDTLFLKLYSFVAIANAPCKVSGLSLKIFNFSWSLF